MRLLRRPLNHNRTAGAGNLDADGVTFMVGRRCGCRWQINRYEPRCCRWCFRSSPCFADPAPDHVGVETVIQGNSGNGDAGLQALRDNSSFEFPGKPATALVGFGYA